MGRLIMMIGLLALFAGWILYRLLIKHNLMQPKGTLFLGSFFLGVSALVSWWLWA